MSSRFSTSTFVSAILVVSLASNVSAEPIYQDMHMLPTLLKAHGLVMGIAFVVMLPLGAMLVRFLKFKGSVWVHAGCQLVGWVLMIAGLATGIRIGNILDMLHSNAHTILGTVVVAALFLQPFLGLVHHWMFTRKDRKTVWTHVHVWYGRILILLGIVNGGLGLQLANNTRPGTIVYGVVAGVVGVGYCGAMLLVEVRNKRRQAGEKSNEAMAQAQS